jgi:ADP-ribose pyrophosphatase YjhB (NUDIX family)
MDRGEQVEQAAMRETLEEANLEVEIERLLNVYSYPGQPTVIIVYLVKIVGGQLKAMDETLEAATFAPAEIPWSELAFDSTKEALLDYLAL